MGMVAQAARQATTTPATTPATTTPAKTTPATTTQATTTQADNTSYMSNPQYKTKIAQIRTIYHKEMRQIQQDQEKYTQHVKAVLNEQSRLRPITPNEVNMMVKVIQKKFNRIEMQLKQTVSEAVIVLRSRSRLSRPGWKF